MCSKLVFIVNLGICRLASTRRHYLCVYVCFFRDCSNNVWGFPGSNGKESACKAWDLGLIPESGRSPGEGNSYPLHYSCLENPMDREIWWAIVHRVTKHLTWLKRLSTRACTKNHSQAVGPRPNWGTSNMCLAGFQNCYGPVTAVCLQFLLFLTWWACSNSPKLVHLMHIGCMEGGR